MFKKYCHTRTYGIWLIYLFFNVYNQSTEVLKAGISLFNLIDWLTIFCLCLFVDVFKANLRMFHSFGDVTPIFSMRGERSTTKTPRRFCFFFFSPIREYKFHSYRMSSHTNTTPEKKAERVTDTKDIKTITTICTS